MLVNIYLSFSFFVFIFNFCVCFTINCFCSYYFIGINLNLKNVCVDEDSCVIYVLNGQVGIGTDTGTNTNTVSACGESDVLHEDYIGFFFTNNSYKKLGGVACLSRDWLTSYARALSVFGVEVGPTTPKFDVIDVDFTDFSDCTISLLFGEGEDKTDVVFDFINQVLKPFSDNGLDKRLFSVSVDTLGSLASDANAVSKVQPVLVSSRYRKEFHVSETSIKDVSLIVEGLIGPNFGSKMKLGMFYEFTELKKPTFNGRYFFYLSHGSHFWETKLEPFHVHDYVCHSRDGHTFGVLRIFIKSSEFRDTCGPSQSENNQLASTSLIPSFNTHPKKGKQLLTEDDYQIVEAFLLEHFQLIGPFEDIIKKCRMGSLCSVHNLYVLQPRILDLYNDSKALLEKCTLLNLSNKSCVESLTKDLFDLTKYCRNVLKSVDKTGWAASFLEDNSVTLTSGPIDSTGFNQSLSNTFETLRVSKTNIVSSRKMLSLVSERISNYNGFISISRRSENVQLSIQECSNTNTNSNSLPLVSNTNSNSLPLVSNTNSNSLPLASNTNSNSLPLASTSNFNRSGSDFFFDDTVKEKASNLQITFKKN
jgi:hypothetical protein